jgi:hypothetical protein
MPSNISKTRLHRAFNEGRRSAKENTQNPYANPKLRQLWEQGRSKELAGELKTPIPPMAHGKTRASRPPRTTPRPSRPRTSGRPPQPPRFGRGSSGS